MLTVSSGKKSSTEAQAQPPTAMESQQPIESVMDKPEPETEIETGRIAEDGSRRHGSGGGDGRPGAAAGRSPNGASKDEAVFAALDVVAGGITTEQLATSACVVAEARATADPPHAPPAALHYSSPEQPSAGENGGEADHESLIRMQPSGSGGGVGGGDRSSPRSPVPSLCVGDRSPTSMETSATASPQPSSGLEDVHALGEETAASGAADRQAEEITKATALAVGRRPEEKTFARVPPVPGDAAPMTGSDSEEAQGTALPQLQQHSTPTPTPLPSLRSQEDRALGGSEILFVHPPPPEYGGWDNLRWLSHSGDRKVKMFQPLYRAFTSDSVGNASAAGGGGHTSGAVATGSGGRGGGEEGAGLWSKLASLASGYTSSSVSTRYEPRALAIYENPQVVLVLIRPATMQQVNTILGLPTSDESVSFLSEQDSTTDHYWIVESVVDPTFCKLRLSQLTTIGSVPGGAPGFGDDPRRRSCFELITPNESVLLSAVQVRRSDLTSSSRRGGGVCKSDSAIGCWTDSGALLETSAVETALVQSVGTAHRRPHSTPKKTSTTSTTFPGFSPEEAWRHQCILGTLHSYVVTADVRSLALSIELAKMKVDADVASDTPILMSSSSEGAAAAAECDSKERSDRRRRLMSRIIDEEDDQGLTPLHYACLRRMSHAVTLLVSAGANVGIVCANDPTGSTLAHVCARNLDPRCLSVLLSACQLPDSAAAYPSKAAGDKVCGFEASIPTAASTSIANSLDAFGRTPLYVAATEGVTASGGTDATALSRCIIALEAWGGTFMPPSSPKSDALPSLQHPVSVLAYRWRPEELSVVLDHVPFRYPWRKCKSQAFEVAVPNLSLSALYHYPVHRAIEALASHRTTADAKEDEHALESRLVRTLRVLLEHSFEPNERVETMESNPSATHEFAGFTPLQVLASIAIDHDGGGPIDDHRARLVQEAAVLLVRSGGRLSVESPPSHRPRRSTAATASGLIKKGSNASSSHLSGGSDHSLRRTKLTLDSKDLMVALGGEKRLVSVQKEWADLKPVDATGNTAVILLHRDDASSSGEMQSQLENTETPGGSNSRSCAICWKEFGTVMNRRHKCRITRRYLCGLCSGKRVVVVLGPSASSSAAEHRVSDGQFLLARIDAAKDRSERAQAQARADEERARVAEEARGRARLERQEAEAQSNRETLFGGLVGQAASFVFGSGDSSASADATVTSTSTTVRQQEQLGTLASSLGETRNAMLERGEKLQNLSDKSAKLVDASSDFARMAKELRKKTESQGLFW